MRAHIVFLIGAILLAVGLGQMLYASTGTETLVLPGCLGTSYTIEVARSASHLTHCWGCYAAGFGAMLMGSAVFLRNSVNIGAFGLAEPQETDLR